MLTGCESASSSTRCSTLGLDEAMARETLSQAVEHVDRLGVHALAGVELSLVEIVLDAGLGAALRMQIGGAEV
jgi:hypothetical protein